MKLIVAIIASHTEIYDKFKKILIDYIIQLNLTNVSFYFLYSDLDDRPANQNKIIYNNYNDELLFTDFYDKDVEYIKGCSEDKRIIYISKSIFKRTLSFFNYLKDNNLLNKDTYILRTNLTTFFDFDKLLKWLENKPNQIFFSGSFNGSYNGINTTISGTNMIMSSDVVLFLSNIDKHHPELNRYSEDELLSLLVVHNLNVYLINIKRLDIIEIDAIPKLNIPYIRPTVCYHKCEISDESIFSFRFKTHDRIKDLECMNYLSQEILKPDFRIEKYVLALINKYKFDLNKEAPHYTKLFSENTFKINSLTTF